MRNRNLAFKYVLQEDDDGRWSAWLASYPACAAWGDTKDEALEALKDMTLVFLEVMEDTDEKVYADSMAKPEGTTSVQNGTISV